MFPCQIDSNPSNHSLRPTTKAPNPASPFAADREVLAFGEILDGWLAQKRSVLRRTTFSTYLSVVENHLRPALGALPAQETDDFAIASFINDISSDRSALSATTARGIVNVLRSVLEYGRAFGVSAQPSSCVCQKKNVRAEISVLTDAEQERLLAYLGLYPCGTNLGILICLKTGLRLGEICALKWGDISFSAGLLCVNRTVSRIRPDDGSEGTQLYFGSPKSASSKRSIPLPPSLLRVLEHRRGEDECFVLSGRADKIVEPRSMQRHFKTVLRRAGIRDMNFHVLRHSFATKCVDLGFDVKSLSMILGHSSVNTTMNTYVHPSLERMRSMMSLLE